MEGCNSAKFGENFLLFFSERLKNVCIVFRYSRHKLDKQLGEEEEQNSSSCFLNFTFFAKIRYGFLRRSATMKQKATLTSVSVVT